MTDEELLDFNVRGFIPGPNESEEAFLTRVQQIKKDLLPTAHWQWPRAQLKELFDFEPESLTAYYSNEKLAPWQGAVCWIGVGNAPTLQLREGFRKGSYLKLYSRGEVLAHEAAHAARAAFQEPKFEEFFAYATAPRKWIRVFGPFFQRSWEPWVLFMSLAIGFFSEVGWVLAAGWMFLGFFRLIRRHRRLSKAFAQVKNFKNPRAFLFRLTDEEIKQLAQGKWLEGDQTLRWRLLKLYRGDK
jgi:hypothetical protein